MVQSYRRLPPANPTPREIALTVNNILDGKMNNVSELNLDTGTASTAISNLNVGPDSVILFMPTNELAATELAAGTMYVSARDKQTFTLSHSTASATRSFSYVVFG